ncbi:hypothetical protein [Streptomyces sp. NPDC101132]|uniref:hypothetical protein n=1 Tax=Streptomyces sp. NPDC101132 TaxID=3366110 RepID=UPI0037FD7679
MGEATYTLLEYLFGPGKRDEHADPHLVTAWDPDVPCPARHPERMGLGESADLLDAPVEALCGARPPQHVWHVSVRNAPGDQVLSDAEWAEVAAAMVDAAGIAPAGDEQACRWIAVRHAEDHIHLVATLARVDGRQPRLRGDILAMHAVARAFEARWGLTTMSPQDRTAVRRPSTGELAKAGRRGLLETARQSLQRTVRTAAALAETDTTSNSADHQVGGRFDGRLPARGGTGRARRVGLSPSSPSSKARTASGPGIRCRWNPGPRTIAPTWVCAVRGDAQLLPKWRVHAKFVGYHLRWLRLQCSEMICMGVSGRRCVRVIEHTGIAMWLVCMAPRVAALTCKNGLMVPRITLD